MKNLIKTMITINFKNYRKFGFTKKQKELIKQVPRIVKDKRIMLKISKEKYKALTVAMTNLQEKLKNINKNSLNLMETTLWKITLKIIAFTSTYRENQMITKYQKKAKIKTQKITTKIQKMKMILTMTTRMRTFISKTVSSLQMKKLVAYKTRGIILL